MNNRQESTDFYKKVFTLALPIAFQSFITIGVNMLDTMMVGSLGDDALTATSMANSFISVFQILCMGLGMGASVLVSRYWGMKKTGAQDEQSKNAGRALKQTVCLMLRLNITLASIFAILTWLIPDIIMSSYSGKPHIIALGVRYFNYSIATYFFVGLSLVIT
ncbi:MAG: MATE family efflux transporter, partial [Lachnospiraceae bacterium]|nr:MATE family efflux transporter [Lachnospiraceae bacterium]